MPWTDPATWSVSELVTAAKMNTHVRDNLSFLDRGALEIHHVGTTPFECWYPLGAIVGWPTLGAGTPYGINVLRAAPFVVPRGGTIDRLAFEVTTVGGAGSVARVGIYQATSATNIYPSARIIDGGEFVTTSTGVKAATVSQALDPATLYWAAYVTGVGTAPAIRDVPADSLMNTLGMPSTLGSVRPGPTVSVAFTYAALPATFPASATRDNNANAPLIAVRYSA